MTGKKILAPTDFSTSARHATRIGAWLAGELGDPLVVAHAWYIPPVAYGPEPFVISGDSLQQMIDDAQRALDDDVATLKQRCTQPVTSVMATGVPPWTKIVDLAEADPSFEVIVMGSHGRTGLKRVLLGSVAEKVIRHSPCSVLVVRGEGEPTPLTDILCPVDFSASSRVAIDAACRLVRPGGSGLTLLHVIEAPVAYSGELDDLDFMRGLDKHATTALDALAASVREQVRVPVNTRIRVGYAGAQTLALLDEEEFDLVALGSHGRTGLARAFLGSVAEKVARHAPCSVWIGRQRAT